MPGFVSNPSAYLVRARVFVLSSAWEGSPRALLEAMACGVPPVITDCPGGPVELIDNERYGLVSPVGDAERIAQAIATMLSTPISPEVLQEHAEEFSVPRLMPKYLDALQVEGLRVDAK
jgi:glycosyltransferase involved in cell wall biosynthesis